MQRSAPQPSSTRSQTAARTSRRSPIRVVVGVAVAALLILIWLITIIAASGTTASGEELSAVQRIQVYAEGCFWAIIVIGIGCGAYIATANRTNT